MRSAWIGAAVLLAAGSAAAQEPESKAVALAKLSALPKPEQQADLDTLKLASAHRERAASMDEKTSGLWQSWLVSICEGCGTDRRPFTDRDGAEYLKALRSSQKQGEAGKPGYVYLAPTGGTRPAVRTSLSSDLSTENIDQIRRDPNR